MDSQLSVMGWEREKERESLLCFPPSCGVWIFPAPQKELGEWPQELERTLRAASQKICVQLPKDPKTSPKRIPENHPRDPCAPPQNPRISPEGSVSIPQRIPEYFPKRSMTSAAEGRAGPGFPAGSGRSPPSSAAGIPHPLRTPFVMKPAVGQRLQSAKRAGAVAGDSQQCSTTPYRA